MLPVAANFFRSPYFILPHALGNPSDSLYMVFFIVWLSSQLLHLQTQYNAVIIKQSHCLSPRRSLTPSRNTFIWLLGANDIKKQRSQEDKYGFPKNAPTLQFQPT